LRIKLANTEDSFGSCHECATKNNDNSLKTVYKCKLCGNNFCQTHLQPKFPYFVDWDNLYDVQGNPEIKALYHSEFNRQDGHPDFVFWRQWFDNLDFEEKERNRLIKQAMDNMTGANTSRTLIAQDKAWTKMNLTRELTNHIKKETKTYENKFGHEFSVPKEIYNIKEYRDRLNNANLLSEVEDIITDYYKHNSEANSDKALIIFKRNFSADVFIGALMLVIGLALTLYAFTFSEFTLKAVVLVIGLVITLLSLFSFSAVISRWENR
jgi:hypothetical protein